MSFNLGNWASQLQCEMCASQPPLDLDLPSDYLDGQLPDDFWDVPPDLPDAFDVELPEPPDYYPSASFPDDGIIININGPLP